MKRVHVEVEFAIVPEWLLTAAISAQAVRLYAVLARFANYRTKKAHPSHKQLAETGRCSVATVRRAIEELEALGALETRGRKNELGQTSNEYVLRVSRPLLAGEQGGLFTDEQGPLLAGEQRNESHSEREEEPTPLSATQTSPHDPDFEQWWTEYPSQRHQGKGAARVAYAKARRREAVDVLLAGARRLAADPNLPVDDPTKIPLPATWLNQERWDDGPLPARRGPPRYESAATRGLRKIAAGREARNGDGSGESGRAGLPAGTGVPRPAD